MFLCAIFIFAVAKLLENAGAIAVLLAPIIIIYLHSLYEEKKIIRKQAHRATQAAVIQVACENNGIISIPLLSLKTNMNFDRCERVLKEMERKEILRRVSDIGKGVVYELDPKTLADYRYHEKPGFYSLNKGYPWFMMFTSASLFFTLVFFDIRQNAYSFPIPYILSVTCSAVLLGMFVLYSKRRYVRDNRRGEETSVLRYVMHNNGELYLKELPYYTRECYETAEPMVSKWHQGNHCTISYSEDGGIIYRFPNYSSSSLVSDYDPDFDPIYEHFKHQKVLLVACCYACIFAVIGGTLLVANYGLVFYSVFAVALVIINFWHFGEKRFEAEEKERMALQVAEAKMGALTVYEVAFHAFMTMEEADKLLRKWERENIARKVEQGEDSAPLYMISGVVSMRERLESEHV